MTTLTTILDLIAGLCVAADFLFPNRIGEKAGRWLVQQLPTKDEVVNPFHRRTILFNATITFVILSLLVAWAIAKDAGVYTTSQVWRSVGLFALGFVIGVILMTSLAFLFYKTGKYLKILVTESEVNPFIWFVSFFIMYLSLLLASSLATKGITEVMTPTATFILAVMILPTSMLSAPSVLRFIDSTPNKRAYTIARIGLVLFIASRVMILTS